jgi:capsular polysaccharide transport system permease protein
MDLWTFIATGIVPYNLFMSSVVRVADSVNGNKALLFYPHVLPIDLAIARALLELATSTVVLAVLMGGHALWLQGGSIANPLGVVGGLLLASLLGTSLGLVFCGLGQMSNLVDRARGPLMRPLFWFSGIFFTAATLPDRARELMLINPVLHCTELVRAGWFAYHDGHGRATYVLGFVLVFALFGLALERTVRQRIELT